MHQPKAHRPRTSGIAQKALIFFFGAIGFILALKFLLGY